MMMRPHDTKLARLRSNSRTVHINGVRPGERSADLMYIMPRHFKRNHELKRRHRRYRHRLMMLTLNNG